MYHYMIGATILKSMRPYIRKYILNKIHPHDYLFLNTFFIGIFVFLFFIYKCLFGNIEESFKKIGSLTWIEIVFFIFLAGVSIVSSLFILELDKKYGNPLINSMILRFISLVCITFISVFVFKEKYTMIQYIGIILTIIGIVLITNK